MSDTGRESREATVIEPSPPAIAEARRHAVIGAALGIFGVVSVFFLPPACLLFFMLAAIYGWNAWLLAADARSAQLTRFALQALTRGDVEAVDDYHARIPEHAKRRGAVARAVSTQRALLALYRSDPSAAIGELGPALDPRTRFRSRMAERTQRALALSVRALCHAMRGEGASVEADAREVESIREAAPEAVARAELARAVVLARAGKRDELRGLLVRRGHLLLESTMPRERGLVRALRTFARADAQSVYRQPAMREEESPRGKAAGWIGDVVPDAAVYAHDAGRGERSGTAVAPPPTDAALSAVTTAHQNASRSAKARMRWRLIGAAVAAAVGVFATFEVASAPSVPGAPSAFSFGEPLGIGLSLFTITLTMAFTVQMRKGVRENLELCDARRALATGDERAARRIYGRLAARGSHLYKACGHAGLASLAERRASFERTVEECTRSVSLLEISPPAIRAMASDQLLPSILGTRAVALAGLEKTERANAELAFMRGHYPSFVHLDLVHLRVRLLSAVRAGDLARARAVARGRSMDSPLPWADDILCDLVLATEPGDLPKSESERIAAELEGDASIRAWIDAVAPGLRDTFARAGARGPRIGELDESTTPVLDEVEEADEDRQTSQRT